MARQTKISYALITKIRNDLQNDNIIKVNNIDGRSKAMLLTLKGEELYMKLAAVKSIMDNITSENKNIGKSESLNNV